MSDSIRSVEQRHVSGVGKARAEPSIPIVVDLDGTLVATDTLIEQVLLLLRRSPFHAFQLAYWLLKGRAFFKDSVAHSQGIDVVHLPYRQRVVDYLRDKREQGARVILATAAHEIDRTICFGVSRPVRYRIGVGPTTKPKRRAEAECDSARSR